VVAKNVAGFTADLESFARQIDVDLGQARRKVAFEIFRSVVAKSPVDTGRFRASWTVADKSPSESVQPTESGSYQPPNPESFGADFTNPFSMTWIANALPYAAALEFGHSKQAPSGMARIAVAEAEANLDALIK